MDELAKIYGILFAVVASVDGRLWQEFGNKLAVPYQGILLKYFPGPQFMPRLNEMLASRTLLPQLVQQGSLTCVLCKPRSDLIVGLFAMAPGDIVRTTIWSEEVDSAVRKVFGVGTASL